MQRRTEDTAPALADSMAFRATLWAAGTLPPPPGLTASAPPSGRAGPKVHLAGKYQPWVLFGFGGRIHSLGEKI